MIAHTEVFEKKFINNPTLDEMPKTADAVIIGGGMVGPAAAWALEQAQPGLQTVLLEQHDQLASGASTASIENFRTAWPTECLAHMMKRSYEIFTHADEYLGEGAQDALHVNERGYLYCGFDGEEAEALQNDVDHLHNLGLDHVEFLDADEVRYRYPWLGENVTAAKFDPHAGQLNSNGLAYQYANNTQDAKYLTGMQNSQVIVENGRVVGVMTSKGKIATEKVIIAAGAGSRGIGETAGITIPVVVRPRQSFTTPWRHEEFPEDAPFVIGKYPYPYVRPEAGTGAIFGWEYHWNNKNTSERREEARDHLIKPVFPIDKLKDPRFPSVTLSLLANQFGHKDGQGFADPRYLRRISHQAGYYVYRDPSTTYKVEADGSKSHYDSERAIIDASPHVKGLYLSVAHVGHGIMSSPTAGEIIAAHVLGQEQSDPLFYQFGLNVNFVENDSGGL